MAKMKKLEKLVEFEDLIEFAGNNEVDVSMYDVDTPVDELRDYIRNAIATRVDGGGDVLSTQNDGDGDGDGDKPIEGGGGLIEPDAVPPIGSASNQNDRSGDTGPHSAPDDNDDEKSQAARLAQAEQEDHDEYIEDSDNMLLDMPTIKTLKGAVRYLAGLSLSGTQMEEFSKAFPGLYK